MKKVGIWYMDEEDYDLYVKGFITKAVNISDSKNVKTHAGTDAKDDKKFEAAVANKAVYKGDIFTKTADTIVKIMDSPGYNKHVKIAAEEDAKGNQVFEDPAAIRALFATDPELAKTLWDSPAPKNDGGIVRTTLSMTKEHPVPILQAAPPGRRAGVHRSPGIVLTDISGANTCLSAFKPPGVLGAGLDVNLRELYLDAPSPLPLPPVQTHPQVFKWTPTPIPKPVYNKYTSRRKGGPTSTNWDPKVEVTAETLKAKYEAVSDKSLNHCTISRTDPDPVIAAQLATLHAQAIMPKGCNNEFSKLCPMEVSGRECLFKITCSLLRCYVSDSNAVYLIFSPFLHFHR
jgi:hypothetical protein